MVKNNQKIPEGWSVKKLEECFSFLKTPSYSRAETTDSGDVHYIHYGDIHTKYPLHVFPKEIDIYVSNDQAQRGDLLKTGDLILLDASEDYEGTTKCIELMDVKDNDKIIAGLHTLALRDNANYFTNGFRAYITSMPFVKINFWKQVSGFKVYGVSKDNLKKLKLLLPPLAEQGKIAGILGTWDEAIEKLSDLIKQKKLLKKGLMQKLLTGKTRLNDFTQPWEDYELSDLLDYEQPTKYLVNDILKYSKEKVPVLTANKAFILGSTDDTCGIYCKGNCIIFDDFTTDMKYVTFPFKVKSSAIKILTSKENVILKFVFEQMKRIKYPLGGHKRNYLSEYQYITIRVPDIAEQTAIADVLSTADDEINLLNKKLEALKEQKKGLMQQLLTGQTRVKVN